MALTILSMPTPLSCLPFYFLKALERRQRIILDMALDDELLPEQRWPHKSARGRVRPAPVPAYDKPDFKVNLLDAACSFFCFFFPVHLMHHLSVDVATQSQARVGDQAGACACLSQARLQKMNTIV